MYIYEYYTQISKWINKYTYAWIYVYSSGQCSFHMVGSTSECSRKYLGCSPRSCSRCMYDIYICAYMIYTYGHTSVCIHTQRLYILYVQIYVHVRIFFIQHVQIWCIHTSIYMQCMYDVYMLTNLCIYFNFHKDI